MTDLNQVAPAAANDSGTLLVQDVSTTQKNGIGETVRVKVGEFTSYIPSLKDFGLNIEPTGTAEDGSLIYSGNAESWLYTAIAAQAKTQARNKLQPKTATLRTGSTMPQTFAEVIEPTDLRASGTQMAERSQLHKAFTAFAFSLGKSENVSKLIVTLFKSPDSLMIQAEKIKQGMIDYVTQFGEAMVEAGTLTDYQAGMLQTVIEAASMDADSLADEF